MQIEANKALIRRLHEEAEGRGELEIVDAIYAPTFIDARHPERGSGPESVKQHIRQLRGRFPDLDVTVEDLIAEGDRVVARVTSRGTHRGSFAGVAATGRQITWRGIVIRRLQDGQVVEQWSKFDLFGLLRQLDPLPATPSES